MAHYLWLKSFHIIFMVAWYAGLFYIFRLFVYHAKFKDQSNMREAYTLMERKLLRIIMYPAMILTILFGILMIVANPYLLQMTWLQVKIGLVILLMGYHFYSDFVHHQFAKEKFILTERACRMMNEIPTLLLFGIVFLVILRPWG